MLLMPLVAFGQTPPPEVDQALRARATEFFQDFVDGQYRKAFALVAEESQDEYFSSSKAEIKSFHIDSIQYNDNFTEATVNLTVTRTWRFQATGGADRSADEDSLENRERKVGVVQQGPTQYLCHCHGPHRRHRDRA